MPPMARTKGRKRSRPRRKPRPRPADKQRRRKQAPGGDEPRDPLARLVAWAGRLFDKEKQRPRPRLGIVDGDSRQVLEARPYVDQLGIEGLLQAAAVLARTAAPDQIVFVFAPTIVTGAAPVAKDRSGLARGRAAALLARSADGTLFGHLWHAEPISRDTRRVVEMDLDERSLAPHGDWTDPSFFVDPTLDERLASKGFPGARSHPLWASPRPTAQAPAAPKQTTGRREVTPSPEHDAKTVAQPAAALPWEAARRGHGKLCELGPGELGRAPLAVVPAAAPAEIRARSLTELLAQPWSSEAQAALLATKLDQEPDLVAGLRAFLGAGLPARPTLLACAAAAKRAAEAQDEPALDRARTELLDRLEAVATEAGGLERWLELQWPAEADVGDELGTVGIACAAVAAHFRLAQAISVPVELPLADDAELAQALAALGWLRDWLLDRAGTPPGEPGDRLATLAAAVLGGEPSPLGEPRIRRWREALPSRRRAPEVTLRYYGAWHATVLHSVHVVATLLIARATELGTDEEGAWRPERVSSAGLLGPAARVLARHLVLRAARVPEPEALGLLARACSLAPGDEIIASCYNEARFRAGDRHEALLDDLVRELRAQPGLGAAAEALRVAERLGRRRLASRLRKQVVALAAETAHGWMAAVRATFARPAELADSAQVARLLDGAAPSRVDPRVREVRALYGAEPERSVARFRRALEAQHEALQWQALVAEIQLDEATAPRGERLGRQRPVPPTGPGEGAVAAAFAALRHRLDRPAMTRSPLKPTLEEHARRAVALVAQPDEPAAAQWIVALGDRERGLVAELDRLITAAAADDESRVRAALERADAALTTALASSWLSATLRRILALWPLAARGGTDTQQLGADIDRLEQEAAAATDEATRGQVERRLTALFDQALSANPPEWQEPPTEAPDDDASAARADPFAPMGLDGAALERSRRQLGTPDWALSEGLRQVAFYNLARGCRDLKLLRGSRDAPEGPLWELRHRDSRHPVRVLYRVTPAGPRVLAILAKQSDAHQRRALARCHRWELTGNDERCC